MSTDARKKNEKAKRKKEISNAALYIMQENGLHGLNIELIAKQTQLAKGTIYLYFRNKEEILSDLSNTARKLLLKEFKKAAQLSDNPVEQLKEIIKSNFKFYKEMPIYSDLVSLYEENNALIETDEMFQSSMAITKFVISIIEKGQSENLIEKNINALDFSMVMWGMTTGMVQLIKLRGELMKDKMNLDTDEIVHLFVSTFENGIRSKN